MAEKANKKFNKKCWEDELGHILSEDEIKSGILACSEAHLDMLQKEHDLVAECYKCSAIEGDIMAGLHQISHFVMLEKNNNLTRGDLAEKLKRKKA